MKSLRHASLLVAVCGVAMLTVPSLANAAAAQASHLADAERMIARCLQHAASQQYPPLSVAVVDTSGTLVAFQRQDGAASAIAEAALLKARTAVRLNAPTSVLAEAVAADAPTRDAFLIMQLTTIPGGVPFADAGGKPLGAIGVSGSANEQDAECARAAVESRAVKQK